MPTLWCVTLQPQLNLGVFTEDLTRTLSPTLILPIRAKEPETSSPRIKNIPEDQESSVPEHLLTAEYFVQLLAEKLQFILKLGDQVAYIVTRLKGLQLGVRRLFRHRGIRHARKVLPGNTKHFLYTFFFRV